MENSDRTTDVHEAEWLSLDHFDDLALSKQGKQLIESTKDKAMSQANGTMTIVKILYQHFGRRPNQKAADFRAELDALSEPEKRDLAEAAAKELGVELESTF